MTSRLTTFKGWLVAVLFGCAFVTTEVDAHAQANVPTGDASVIGDLFPNRDIAEVRARLFVEEKAETGRLRFTVSGFAEGLLRRQTVQDTSESAGIVRFLDANLEYKTARADLLAGLARVSWGRLDELQPTDVVNPLDVSKFFLEGRSEARLPVGLVRARVFLSDDVSIEGIMVPFFRRGRFDQLGEGTSPFNIATSLAAPAEPGILAPSLPIVVDRTEPAHAAANIQAGARFNATTRRVDWSLSAFRGLEPFGLGTLLPPSPQGSFAVVRISYPRFTMVGGDFETVCGKWGLRGEVGAFVEDSFQDPAVRIVAGSSVDAGVGLDRKAGDYRVSGSVLLHDESYDVPIDVGDGPENGRRHVSFVLSTDRTFAGERYNVRVFGVYNPSESSAFVRGIARAAVRDNLALEGSIGWFASEGRDTVGRFAESDFLYARVKYYF